MHKDEVKGKVKDIKGRIRRQAGEWIGDTESQVKGAGEQLEGKVQSGVGHIEDEAQKAMREMRKPQPEKPERKLEKDKERRAA